MTFNKIHSFSIICFIILMVSTLFARDILSPDGDFSAKVSKNGRNLIIRNLEKNSETIIQGTHRYIKDVQWFSYEGWPYVIYNSNPGSENGHYWLHIINPSRGKSVFDRMDWIYTKVLLSQGGFRYKDLVSNGEMDFNEILQSDIPAMPKDQAKTIHASLVHLNPINVPSSNSDVLYPLGFSLKGLFAYLIDHSNGGCGDCPFIIIHNLQNDRVEFQETFEGNIRYVIRNHGKSITEALNEHKILPVKEAELRYFPFNYKNVDFTVRFIKEQEFKYGRFSDGKKYSTRLGFTGSFDLFLIKGKKKRKKLGSIELNSSSNVDRVEGFFLSPFEDRIAVISSGLQTGYEGGHKNRFHVFGAHLFSGF